MTTLVPERLTSLLERCRREVDEGRIPGCQVALGFDGEVVLFEAFGDLTTDHRLHTYSAVKPTVALTVLALAADGLLDLHAPIATVLPTFATGGKDRITLSQVLLHAGGFPHAPMPVEEFMDRDARLRRYEQWRTTWEPGTRFEYHASSAHWVLADCITAVTGRHHSDVIAERIMEPAGCRRWLAIAVDDQRDVASAVSVGEPLDTAELSRLYGMDDPPPTEVTDEALLAFNDPGVWASGHPGGGGIASAADIARWYQAVLHDDGQLLAPEVRIDALGTIRQRHPDWLGTPANRTHAFVVAGDDGKAAMRGFGHTTRPAAFGHGGAKGQVGWADPTTGVSFGFLTHGLDRNELVHAHRTAAVSSAAGLATTPAD